MSLTETRLELCEDDRALLRRLVEAVETLARHSSSKRRALAKELESRGLPRAESEKMAGLP